MSQFCNTFVLGDRKAYNSSTHEAKTATFIQVIVKQFWSLKSRFISISTLSPVYFFRKLAAKKHKKASCFMYYFYYYYILQQYILFVVFINPHQITYIFFLASLGRKNKTQYIVIL